MIDGGAGTDQLTGGAAADTFLLRSTSESQVGASLRDRVLDFQDGTDLFNFSAIDADTTTAGNQAFSFIGAAGFSGTAGQLRSVSQASITLVSGDVDGDSAADFELELTGAFVLDAGDFIL